VDLLRKELTSTEWPPQSNESLMIVMSCHAPCFVTVTVLNTGFVGPERRLVRSFARHSGRRKGDECGEHDREVGFDRFAFVVVDRSGLQVVWA
jgi:hypothetical protein